MALKYTTNQNAVKVYNPRGVDVSTIANAGTVVLVLRSNVVHIRGLCYEIAAPFAGYVLASRIRREEIADPVPPPDEPPPAPEQPEVTLMEITWVSGKPVVIMTNGDEWRKQ